MEVLSRLVSAAREQIIGPEIISGYDQLKVCALVAESLGTRPNELFLGEVTQGGSSALTQQLMIRSLEKSVGSFITIKEPPPNPTHYAAVLSKPDRNSKLVRALGWKIDPHSHTDLSDGMFNPWMRHWLAYWAGLDIYGATDHDAANNLSEPPNIPISFLNGVEVTTGVGHLLLYAPACTPLVVPKMGLRFSDTVYEAKSRELKVIIPHCNFGGPPGSIPASEIRRLYEDGLSVDGIEVRHPNFKTKHEQWADRIAERYNIARLGTGDDHTGNIGRKWITRYPRLTDNPEEDFWTALEDRTTYPDYSKETEYDIPHRELIKRHAKALFVGLGAKYQSKGDFAESLFCYLEECFYLSRLNQILEGRHPG